MAVNLQKGHLASSKFIYTSLYKKSLEARMSAKIHKLSKGEKVNKLGGNYSISTRLNLKTRCISEKKKNTIVSEMSWCNILQRTGSYFCATNNFQVTFTPFCLNIFIQERIIAFVDRCPWNLASSKYRFQCAL